ncbi:MAG: zinc-binding dehydrogenase, partial [Acetobacter sp.]|nr:zinc-binding dehydrogenase [Acetobacter sp.]
WSNLFMPTILPTGTRVLIHGGASGIGTMAIQLVHAFGGEVYTTAGTEKKCALCKELGAVAAINYREEDFLSRIRALTDDMGVNVILDIIGGSYFNQNLKSLATDGKLVIIALQGGAKADQADLSRIMTRRLTVTGSTLRARNKANKICIAQDLYKHVWPLLEAGTAVPLIHAVFPLDRVADAHQIMEDGQHSGKIVLEC